MDIIISLSSSPPTTPTSSTTTATAITSQSLAPPPPTTSPTTTITVTAAKAITVSQPLSPSSPTPAPTGPKDGWELERKHIFILSSSGKPIFSRYGDEQELVTTFGLLQAVISITTTSNSNNDNIDQIKMIRAGNRKFVYYLKKSLYFILITSTNEPEIILIKHLKFLNKIILLVLTSKVYDVYKKNSCADIRDLLGIDTLRLISSSCYEILTPTNIVYNSINSIICNKELRDDIISHLSTSVNASNAV
jgi:hypothetical protein